MRLVRKGHTVCKAENKGKILLLGGMPEEFELSIFTTNPKYYDARAGFWSRFRGSYNNENTEGIKISYVDARDKLQG